MRLTQLACAGVILLTAAPRNACWNECDFVERCNGNVRETCGGIDQCVGRRVWAEPCPVPNDACVEEGTRALCVKSPPTRCDSTFVDRCEGAVWIHCSRQAAGFIVAEDCAAVKRPDGTSAALTCGPGASERPQCVTAR